MVLIHGIISSFINYKLHVFIDISRLVTIIKQLHAWRSGFWGKGLVGSLKHPTIQCFSQKVHWQLTCETWLLIKVVKDIFQCFFKKILSFSCLRTTLKNIQTNSIFCIAQHSMMIVNLRYYQSRRDHQNQVLGIWTRHHAFDPTVCLREEGEYWTSWWVPVVYEAPHGTSGSLSCAFLRDIRLTCNTSVMLCFYDIQ